MEIRESLKIAKLYEKIRDAYFVNIKFTEGREKFNKEWSESLQTLITFAEEALNKPSVGVEEVENYIVDLKLDVNFKLDKDKTNGEIVILLNKTVSNGLAQALLEKFTITRRGKE